MSESSQGGRGSFLREFLTASLYLPYRTSSRANNPFVGGHLHFVPEQKPHSGSQKGGRCDRFIDWAALGVSAEAKAPKQKAGREEERLSHLLSIAWTVPDLCVLVFLLSNDGDWRLRKKASKLNGNAIVILHERMVSYVDSHLLKLVLVL